MKYSVFILLIIFLSACQNEGLDESYQNLNDENPDNENIFLDLELPSNFPEPTYEIENNRPTQAGFELGKKLFYDGKLSSTGVISCGFCHIQDFAFTHHTHIVSHGVNGALGTRNAPSLQNMIFMEDFNWDGSVSHLDAQPIVPITTEFEMNESIANVLTKLQNDEEYVQLFNAAFENDTIDTQNMLRAISQFVMMMVSADSKYDKVVRNEGSHFNEMEEAGKAVFNQKCAGCHSGSLFTDQSYRNNGLPIDPQYDDEGRMRVTGEEADKYKFKVPSLRNIAVTFPYMHDGRFQTLRDVLDHYDSGVVQTQNLDSVFIQENGQLGIPLTEIEKDQIIAYLNTLTDDNFLLDDRFSEF
ncbi:MAG: c-type cytochrome [Bacteroidetes bacterium]|jgi:cytochrome c peroxidase|nr:c-type cytochrome [Bacteroidota bacterium]